MEPIGGKNLLGSRSWLMNIWYEFGKDWLKTIGQAAHTRKKELGPLVAKNETAVSKINWHLGLALWNVWCKFKNDPLKALGLQCTQETNELGPPVVTNGIAGHQKSIVVKTLIHDIFGVNLKKIS